MPEEIVVLFLSVFAMVGATVLLFPVMRALAERIRPRLTEANVKEELQLLREDLLSEIQQARREIGDLGERVDFTERLLSKKTER
ncbi:MAG TPA: hypothetical protein VN513_16160 [Gemmatimonadales bacterium]|jgi:hypothetical protein|nr:hypothetical protein [Gemmatimonadales bacterium]